MLPPADAGYGRYAGMPGGMACGMPGGMRVGAAPGRGSGDGPTIEEVDWAS